MVAGALLLLVLAPGAPVVAAPPSPPVEDVTALAGRYVARLEEQLAVLVADESYVQALFINRESSARQRRALGSDAVWVPTGDQFVWAFFRDVREVDGDPVRDREERLEHLFPSGMTAAGNARALEILEESSRYNLGTRRNVNCPTVALSFLHPRNQARFAFRLDGPEDRQDAATWKVRFTERERPALTRTSRGEDVPARGALWIESASGALVSSRLELRPPRLGRVVIETLYARHDRLGGWLPEEMREAYGSQSSDQRVEGIARYSAWRRAQVDVQPIVPVR